jgi:arylsulfatase A-like enzyme
MIRKSLAAFLLAVACSRSGLETRRTYPNAPVIIISIDTVRADHLPAYGYRNIETPNIDGFRRDAILFQNAYAHVPMTLPSHVSMLTGQLPTENGVRNNIGYRFQSRKQETIPSLLRKRGYATGAAVSAYVLRGATGLGDAFDFYDDKMEIRGGLQQGEVQRSGLETSAVAERWIEQQRDRPFFFLLHLYEPHTPYDPPEPYRSRFALPYDGEIATADAIVGQFLDFLKRQKIYDRAVIVLMSDHGEGLNEHGEQEHGIFVYREDLHVPLIVKLPGNAQANRSIAAPAALIDIFPTIAALVGADPPALGGTSLLELDNHPARTLYAESLYPRIHLGWSELRSLIDDRHHYISAPRAELYDFTSDTAERNNILDSDRRVAARMRGALAAYGTGVPAMPAIDAEEAKKLAALGYLSSPSVLGAGALADPKDHIGEVAIVADAAKRDSAGDHDAAIAALKSVLAKNAGFTDAWTLLAKAQERSGRFEDAIASYRQAIHNAPSLAIDNALSIASLSLNIHRLDEAESHAQLAASASPAEAHVILGRVAIARRNLADAEREAKMAVAADADNANAQVLLAQVYASGGRYAEAMRIIETVSRAHQQPIEMLDFIRGDILARTRHNNDAIAAFQREIHNFPLERQAYASLAAVYFFSGRPDAAKQTMESLVSRMPQRDTYLFASETFDSVGADSLAAYFRKRSNHLLNAR